MHPDLTLPDCAALLAVPDLQQQDSSEFSELSDFSTFIFNILYFLYLIFYFWRIFLQHPLWRSCFMA